MPSARTTIFGSDLKSRLGVNGIQYSSSEIRRGCSWSRSVNSAWPIVISSCGKSRAAENSAAGKPLCSPNALSRLEPVVGTAVGQAGHLPSRRRMRHDAACAGTFSPSQEFNHSRPISHVALSGTDVEPADPAHLQEPDQPAGTDSRNAGRGDPRWAHSG